MESLLDTLESCTSITRLSLVCPSPYDSFVNIVSKEDFASRLIRLCEKLSRLVALFCYFRVPIEFSKEANSTIKQRFKRERPALRVDIQPMIVEDESQRIEIEDSYHSDEFPFMYNDLLTSFQSQVALFPIHCNSFFQRTF